MPGVVFAKSQGSRLWLESRCVDMGAGNRRWSREAAVFLSQSSTTTATATLPTLSRRRRTPGGAQQPNGGPGWRAGFREHERHWRQLLLRRLVFALMTLPTIRCVVSELAASPCEMAFGEPEVSEVVPELSPTTPPTRDRGGAFCETSLLASHAKEWRNRQPKTPNDAGFPGWP